MNVEEPGDFDNCFDVQLPDCPYPGLRPFTKDEWPIFFGRERMVEDITAVLLDRKFVTLHGDSGCGKSSLVRAGILPRLEQEHARTAASWVTAEMQPGDSPMRNLAAAFAGFESAAPCEERISAFHRILNLGGGAAKLLTERLQTPHNRVFCLLVDQFEELFAFARRRSDTEAALFVDVLAGLYQHASDRVHVIITMRSEFLGACARYSGLADIINATQYLLPRMSRQALMRSIQEPAVLYQGCVESALAAQLIADAGSGQDHLPLIQHGLMLFSRRAMAGLQADANGDLPPWTLTLADYRDSASVSELLSLHADEVLEDIVQGRRQEPDFPTPADRAARHRDTSDSAARMWFIERVFRALTDIDADGHAIRRPQTLGSLAAVAGISAEDLNILLKPLRCDGVSFLRPYGEGDLEAGDLIDISHEALIRCWRRISAPDGTGWLQREFEDGLIWKSLQVQARSFASKPGEVLSPASTRERRIWLLYHSPAWAQRYGGGWEQVQELMRASLAHMRRQNLIRSALALAVVILFAGAALYVAKVQESQEIEKLADSLKEERDEARAQNRIIEATSQQAQERISNLSDRNEELTQELQSTWDQLELAIDKNAQIANALAEAGKRDDSAAILRERLGTLEAELQESQQKLASVGQQALSASARATAQRKEDLPLPEMVWIEPGCFQMGADVTSKAKSDNKLIKLDDASEYPPHQVCLPRGFNMGSLEVTFDQYDAFAVDTGRRLPDDEGWGRKSRPVINVTWQDAMDYAQWLGEQTRVTCSLPSEAQWEYAARAGTSSVYSWGDEIGTGNANCSGCGIQKKIRQTVATGSFAPNRWGLHDMHGNVWEWVRDCWHDNYQDAPADGSAWLDARNDQCKRVVRGGSWEGLPTHIRTAIRGNSDPDERGSGLGFRVACSARALPGE